jgi:Clostripain family
MFRVWQHSCSTVARRAWMRVVFGLPFLRSYRRPSVGLLAVVSNVTQRGSVEMPNNNSEFKNDWTLMFFFASDNPLAPLLVSQLKAIKDAGFQEHTEVLVYFDPMEKGWPTKIYNVNKKRKAYANAKWEQDKDYPKTKIGDGNDSFVRKMEGDEVDSATFPTAMQTAMDNPRTTPAHEALTHFVQYGIEKHRARNYMLFLIGHGMIVGRDMFLPDADPVSAITLEELQAIMKEFLEEDKTTRLRLLSLHSCSMSSIEVAYQLRGTANYMIAHQGPAFVNSWPYRQLLKKIFNTIEKTKRGAGKRAQEEGKDQKEVEQAIVDARVNVKRLVEKLYYHCLYNATDFLSAGYSADLALCSLAPGKVTEINEPLQKLVRKLKANLDQPSIIKDLILLAHWESQSFWDENYTDLNDFCICLSKGCNERAQALEALSPGKTDLIQELRDVRDRCDDVSKVLNVINSEKRSERFNGLVVHEDNFGWKYQYARGLSVYFPWCEPLDDEPLPLESTETRPRSDQTGPDERSWNLVKRYTSYEFNTELGDDSWWSFLKLYFEKTKRPKLDEEEGFQRFSGLVPKGIDFDRFRELLEKAELSFYSGGTLSSRTPETGRTPTTGEAPCTCPTIKNYPTDVDKTYPSRRVKKFSITPGALQAFRQEFDLIEEEPVDDDDHDDADDGENRNDRRPNDP